MYLVGVWYQVSLWGNTSNTRYQVPCRLQPNWVVGRATTHHVFGPPSHHLVIVLLQKNMVEVSAHAVPGDCDGDTHLLLCHSSFFLSFYVYIERINYLLYLTLPALLSKWEGTFDCCSWKVLLDIVIINWQLTGKLSFSFPSLFLTLSCAKNTLVDC